MALTYLELTNIALREVNEVPLSEQEFINARGLQRFAKEAVNRAYLDIVNSSREWIWLKEQNTGPIASVVTNVSEGDSLFNIDPIYNQIDWNTIYITDKDMLVNDPTVVREISKNLKFIEYEEWVEKYREDDLQDDRKGDVPSYVYMHPDKNTVGFSPKSNANYSIVYDAWKVATFLELPTDTLAFPDEHYNTLISRARYYLWLFRENDRQAGFAKNDYEVALRNMQSLLTGNHLERIRAY